MSKVKNPERWTEDRLKTFLIKNNLQIDYLAKQDDLYSILLFVFKEGIQIGRNEVDLTEKIEEAVESRVWEELDSRIYEDKLLSYREILTDRL